MMYRSHLTLLLYINLFVKALPQNDSVGDPLLLTPYLERGQIEEAKYLSAVNPEHFAGVNSHAAYFTVNKTNKWHLFFWYFPVLEAPLETTPLVVWLAGGPGCSSLSGLFDEIGPLQIKDGKVERMPITWGSNYSLLFIDNPVGTGFSFTEVPDQYVTNEDMIGATLLTFIEQFLQVFTEVKDAPLFIAGESYAGKYIPAFGHYIHHNKNKTISINLKGMAIGNGWIDPPTLHHYSEWGLQVGLIDHEQAEEIHQLEEDARKYWDEHNMTAFEEKASDAYHLLIHYAPVYLYNYIQDAPKPSEVVNFMNKQEIQSPIHAKNMDFIDCNYDVYQHLRHDIYDTVKPWLEELLEHYGVMCYSGQLDLRIAYALSVHTYRSLNWSGREAYQNASKKPVFDETDSRKVNSFVKASGNFMDVMVRSAGHMVASDQPGAAKQIIDMFIEKFK